MTVDELAYTFWSIHPTMLDEWIASDPHPPIPEGYRGGVRAWFFACEMRKLIEEERDRCLAHLDNVSWSIPEDVMMAVTFIREGKPKP